MRSLVYLSKMHKGRNPCATGVAVLGIGILSLALFVEDIVGGNLYPWACVTIVASTVATLLFFLAARRELSAQ